MLIQTEFQQSPFVAVPRHVIKLVGEGMSADALGVLVWLAARPVGAQVAVPTICKAFGFGKDKWQRIARELRALGALLSTPLVCRQTNRVYGKSLLVRWPEGGETRLSEKPENPKAGKPGFRAGKPGSKKPENPAPIKDQRIKERARGSRAAPSAPSASPHNAASGADRDGEGPQGRGADPAARAGAVAGLAGEKMPHAQAWRKASIARALGQRWRNPVADTWHGPETPLPESARALAGGA